MFRWCFLILPHPHYDQASFHTHNFILNVHQSTFYKKSTMHPLNMNWNGIYTLKTSWEDWEVSYTEIFLVPKNERIWRSNLSLLSILSQSHFHSLFRAKHLQRKAYSHHTLTQTPKDYFQVKFYVHDCYVQLQYVALDVMDHCNAFYHILVMEFGKYHISSCTESCPMVPYPFGQSVFYHCRTYNTFML